MSVLIKAPFFVLAVDMSTSLKQQQKWWRRLERAERQLNERYDWNVKINTTWTPSLVVANVL